MAVPTTDTACPLHSSWKSRFERSGDAAEATPPSGEGHGQRQARAHRSRRAHRDHRVPEVVEQLARDHVRGAEFPQCPLLGLGRAHAALAVAGGGVLQVPDHLQLQPGPEAAQTLDAASELARVAVSPRHPGSLSFTTMSTAAEKRRQSWTWLASASRPRSVSRYVRRSRPPTVAHSLATREARSRR